MKARMGREVKEVGTKELISSEDDSFAEEMGKSQLMNHPNKLKEY